nr:hypothetical protein CFP56_20944 [Quercus suber]
MIGEASHKSVTVGGDEEAAPRHTDVSLACSDSRVSRQGDSHWPACLEFAIAMRGSECGTVQVANHDRYSTLPAPSTLRPIAVGPRLRLQAVFKVRRPCASPNYAQRNAAYRLLDAVRNIVCPIRSLPLPHVLAEAIPLQRCSPCVQHVVLHASPH